LLISPEKYKQLVEQIENNMIQNGLNMASITIEYKPLHKKNKTISISRKQSKKSIKKSIKKPIKKTSKNIKKTAANNIHQIFIIAINNKSYNASIDWWEFGYTPFK
jgi:hypothetical protein